MKHCYIFDYSTADIYHVKLSDSISTNEEIESYLSNKFNINFLKLNIMEKIVVIFIVASALIGWISYLIYNYKINGSLIIVYKKKYEDINSRYKILQDCVRDLILDINHKLPGSSLEYRSDENNEIIRGEIKYKK